MLERIEGDAAKTMRRIVPQPPGGESLGRLMEGDGDEDWDNPGRGPLEGVGKVQQQSSWFRHG